MKRAEPHRQRRVALYAVSPLRHAVSRLEHAMSRLEHAVSHLRHAVSSPKSAVVGITIFRRAVTSRDRRNVVAGHYN
jgi:hypothetical protein